MSHSTKNKSQLSKNKRKKLMIINSCCGGFVMIGGAATTGILCTQNQLRNTITTIDLSTLLSGYTSVGNFKTAPDFMGVLEQVKQNMIDGGATNVLSLNDVQLRSGTWNALSGCVIEPKNASVQYTGSATLSWTVSSKKQISDDLTNTSIPATSKFNGTPNAAMILKALKQLSGNGNMQLNQLDVKNIVLVPDQSGIGTGSADVVPTAHSVVYNENTTLNPDEVSVSFSYISEPVDLNTIITTKNLGNFDEAPTVADLFGRMFSLNTTADIMFNPSDLTLTITSSGSATVIANDAAHFYGTVNLAWTVNNRINIQNIFMITNCGYFIEQPTSADIWTRAKTLNYTNASALIPDELTWDILYNSVTITVQTSPNKATMTVINTSTRFTGSVEFNWILDTRMDIHDLIPNVALGNIPAIGGVVSESEIRNAVERANPTSTIIWSDLTISIDQQNNKASIAPKPTSSNYSGTYVTVFFNALNSGGVDGTNWQGHTSGTITTLLNTTASVVPYQIVGNATLSDVSSFVADNLLIPDYIFDNSNSCFYKLTKINDSAFDGAKATLTGSLTLGNNIEIIGAKAFLNKSSLSGPLLIPDSVKQIKNSAFSWCTGFSFDASSTPEVKYSMTDATHHHKWCFGYINPNIKTEENIAITNGTYAVADNAFYSTSVIRTLALPDGLTSIGSYAFSNCANINDSVLTIPQSIVNICEGAFSSTGWGSLGAPALKLALPNQFDHPMTIGDKAFNYANIVIDDTANPGKAILSKNIKSIGFEAFRNDNKMVGQIYLPDSLETMSNDVFVGTNLTWDSTTHTGLTCSYDDINGYATWIKSCEINPVGILSLPSGTHGVLQDAFRSKCGAVTSIILPSGLTNISSYAFYGNMNLTPGDFVIPDTVVKIGERAFANNASLSDMRFILPLSLKEIGTSGSALENTNMHQYVGHYTTINPPLFLGASSTGNANGTVTNIGDLTSQELLTYMKLYANLPSGWTAS